MTHDRDIAAFDLRAATYESGWRAELHRQVAHRTCGIVLDAGPSRRVLDIGCGTGLLLRMLAELLPARWLSGPCTWPGRFHASALSIINYAIT